MNMLFSDIRDVFSKQTEWCSGLHDVFTVTLDFTVGVYSVRVLVLILFIIFFAMSFVSRTICSLRILLWTAEDV